MSILSTSSKLVRVGDSYSAGEGISIENNTISVTGDYGHAYYPGENISISDDNVISSKDWSSDIDTAVQNASAETTAWVDSQNYLTDASMSDYALITDVETTSGILKMDIDTVSGSISGKMDSTAFNDWQNGQYSSDIAGLTNNIDAVSGAVDAISGAVSSLDIPTHQEIINASGYAYSQSTAWTDSQGYLTQHQDISYLATKNEVDTVSSFLSGAIDYVSANAGDEFPASANDAITAYQTYSGTYLTAHQDISNKLDTTAFSTVSGTFLTAHQSLDGYLTKSSADTLYQPIGSYASQTDLEQVSGDLKSDIDYISGIAITAHQDISNKLDTSAVGLRAWYDGKNIVTGIGGSALFAEYSLSAWSAQYSKSTLRDEDGYYLTTTYTKNSALNDVSSTLSGAIDYVSGQIPVIPDISATEWNSVYNSVESNSGLWNEMSAYQNVSSTFLTAVDLSNYYTKSQTSGADELANAFANIPAGDADVNSYVQGNSATIDNVNSTVQTNSAQWAEGVSVDTISVAVISPLVTGFSGESAYLGIESTALNLSSYVPVSAIGVNYAGYVSGISGRDISARYAVTANYAYTAIRSYLDRNGNEITSYYQPKLTISGDAGTITSINGSAVGASIPEGWELVAGQGIEIVDDSENNQTTISVTAAGGNPEVESYVQTNSASIDDAVSTYQTNSGSYITQETDWTNTITAASSYAYSEAVAQIPAPFDPTYMSGAIDQNASDIQYISGVAITAHQDISNKLDTTAFSNVSGSFLTAVNIPESASWNEVSTAYQTNSATYLTAHQSLEGYAVESAFEYNGNDLITAYNGSAFAGQGGGGEVPTGTMNVSALEYNAVNEISGYNGSAIAQYGAEKQWLVHDDTLVHAANSAQYALGCNISALQRLMGIDETVLWEGQMNTTAQTGQFSEKPNNFRILRVVTLPDVSGSRPSQINDFDMEWNTNDTNQLYVHWQTYNIGSNTYSGQTWYLSGINGGLDFKLLAGIKQVNGTVTNNLTAYQGSLRKVIGIGRKQ